MKSLINVLLLSAALFSTAIFAAQEGVAQNAAKLRQLLDAMTTLKGRFTQTLYDNQGEVLEQSQGNFVMQRPGKFYWKTEQPFPQLLVSDQHAIWLYDPDLEQVTVRPVGDDLQKTPALLLSEDVEKLRQHFTIEQQGDETQQKFILVPKESKGLFQQLVLVFVSGHLQEFHLQDNLGQLTHFALTATEHNQPVDATLFQFTPPPGVDVLHD